MNDRDRRRLVSATKRALRDLRIELSVLNHKVGQRVELRDIDFDCLDVVVRHGPIGPTVLARRVGVHAATMTGVLNRLESAGWVVRERLPDDRRGVLIRARPERQRDVLAHFNGMNTAMDEVCERYTDDQLAIIVDFLEQTSDAGRTASAELSPTNES